MQKLNAAAVEAVYNKSSYTNLCVDGVSYESDYVRRSICNFLSGVTGFLGCTDTNHNMKSMRYQLVGGSCAVTIGRCVVDAEILRQSGVSTELWRPTDFASNILMLKLASCESVHKINRHVSYSVSDALDFDVVSLMVTLTMIRIHLFSVNSSLMDLNQRAVFLWATIIWFTSLKGAYFTTKRNLVCEGFPLYFFASSGRCG